MKKYIKNCIFIIALSAYVNYVRADNYYASFARGNWNSNEWIAVKSPRFSYLGEMIQQDDHIVNRTPNVPDDELLKKYGADVYACLMLDKKFGWNAVISSEMSFDHLMAPLIVIAGEIGKDASGTPEHREHYEIVLFYGGINIWHHTYKDGKPSWCKAAFMNAKFLPGKRYNLQVELKKTTRGKIMTISCGGYSFGFCDNNLPDSYYTGIIGCEGRNRFYDFRVKSN